MPEHAYMPVTLSKSWHGDVGVGGSTNRLLTPLRACATASNAGRSRYGRMLEAGDRTVDQARKTFVQLAGSRPTRGNTFGRTLSMSTSAFASKACIRARPASV